MAFPTTTTTSHPLSSLVKNQSTCSCNRGTFPSVGEDFTSVMKKFNNFQITTMTALFSSSSIINKRRDNFPRLSSIKNPYQNNPQTHRIPLVSSMTKNKKDTDIDCFYDHMKEDNFCYPRDLMRRNSPDQKSLEIPMIWTQKLIIYYFNVIMQLLVH
jgi:hypothetical protein